MGRRTNPRGGEPPAKAVRGRCAERGGDRPQAAKQLAENRKLLEEFDQLSRDFIALQALLNQTTTDPKRAKTDGERLKKMADDWLRPMNQKVRDELGIAAGRPIPKSAVSDESADAGEAKKFDGEWKVVSLESGSRTAPAVDVKGMRWSIKGGGHEARPGRPTGKFLFR